MTKHRCLFLLFWLFASTHFSLADEYTVSGILRDGVTKEPIASGIIRVAGTSRGTICNTEGAFRLKLDAGNYGIVFSSLGYRSDTLGLSVSSNRTINIELAPTEIALAEIVVTSEDPARAIMRQAIGNKKRWIDRLQSYEMDAFTRQVLKRDTSIASITEAYTKGYWQQGDTLHEIVLQKRQTENIKESFNFASVGRLLNFYDDNIRFVGYTFVGPIADDAFDNYDYKLLRTRKTEGSEIHEIQLIPQSATVPSFSGSISIAGDSYALVGVDVVPNQSFNIPFVKEKSLRYRQQFALYEQTYWLPADIRIDASFKVGVVGFTFPVIGFSQTSAVTNYTINIPLPDSIFKKQRLVVDSSATSYDSTFWSSSSVLPMTTEEEQAYQTLDSTATLDVQFRPGGIGMTLGGDGSEGAFSALSLLDISFNRIEGVHTGVRFDEKDLLKAVDIKAGLAYGFSDKASKYELGATVYPFTTKFLGFGGAIFRKVVTFPGQGYYGNMYNSLTSLLNKNDYHNYYKTEGWTTFVKATPAKQLEATFSFNHESHIASHQTTDYSLFYKSRSYRANPLAMEGKLRSLSLAMRLGDQPVPLDLVSKNALDFAVEYSSTGFAGSSFDFLRYHTVISLSFQTFGHRYLLPPGIRLRLAAGTATGTVPLQRTFFVESASSSFGPFGVMRAMHVQEFSGTQYVALTAEHNFRSLPFLALGIPFLYENSIEFIVHGGLAKSWNNSSLPLNPTGSLYTEVGFGISRIIDILRCDFTWRLSRPGEFRFTLGAAGLL